MRLAPARPLAFAYPTDSTTHPGHWRGHRSEACVPWALGRTRLGENSKVPGLGAKLAIRTPDHMTTNNGIAHRSFSNDFRGSATGTNQTLSGVWMTRPRNTFVSGPVDAYRGGRLRGRRPSLGACSGGEARRGPGAAQIWRPVGGRSAIWLETRRSHRPSRLIARAPQGRVLRREREALDCSGDTMT